MNYNVTIEDGVMNHTALCLTERDSSNHARMSHSPYAVSSRHIVG